MKKLIICLIALLIPLNLSACALTELFNDKENIVNLGNDDKYVKWSLVENNNVYSDVESAYFEFNDKDFKYYEDGVLKKEGTHRITYNGVEDVINPLVLVLNFGEDEDGLRIFDYVQCYTEDSEENLHQFTIMSEGYHIEPLRQGGVPVRDYHLSDMPYAFGTYLKESTEKYSYSNGKANYLGCAKLDGKFFDDKGNMFYFLNNAYSKDDESSSYTVYMRYENNVNNTFIEGTICLSYYDDFYTNKRCDVALIYVMHGDGEPAKESGVSVEADYELKFFIFSGDSSLSFVEAKYFDEESECDFGPSNFIGGTYNKITTK